MIVKNPLIRDWRNWSETFSKDLYFGVSSGSNFYRPIQTLSNIWDYHIWQWDPFGYHLTNIVLQILASFLVLLFVHSLTGKIAISFSSALLFALSPLHTEAVTYISGRADLLMGIFLLTAFLLFKKSQNSSGSNKPIFLSLSLIFFTLGLLSKELAVVFPLVILSFIFYYRRGDFRKPAYLIKSVLPFIIIDCLYGILRLTSLKFLTLRPPELTKYPFLIRMTLFPKVIFTYIKMFILPINLHMSYTLVRPVSFIELFIACFLLQIMILGCIYILVYKRDKKIVPFMLSWFLVFLLPQSGIFPINAFVSEHFIYLSSISFFMLLAYLLYRFLRKELFIFSIIGLSSFYGIQTFARNFEWQNPVVFYEKIIKFSPDSVQAHNNLGLQYEYRHLYNQAIREYKKALEIMPNLLEAHSNLANLYFKMGNLEEAKREYAIVEKTAPGSKIGEIQNNIGCIYETE
jgi:hypothetical protein